VIAFANFLGEQVDVHRLVVQIRRPFFRDLNHRKILDVLLDGLHLGNFHLQAELHDVGGEHEDNQQHEHNVHQRNDVDLGQRRIAAKPAAP